MSAMRSAFLQSQVAPSFSYNPPNISSPISEKSTSPPNNSFSKSICQYQYLYYRWIMMQKLSEARNWNLGPSFEIRYSMSPVKKGVLCHSSILGTIGFLPKHHRYLSSRHFNPYSNVAHSSPQTLPSFPGHPISVIPL